MKCLRKELVLVYPFVCVYCLSFFYSRECKYEQDLDFSNTQRQLNYRRRKDQIKKKLIRLKKLQKLREEAEVQGEQQESVKFQNFVLNQQSLQRFFFLASNYNEKLLKKLLNFHLMKIVIFAIEARNRFSNMNFVSFSALPVFSPSRRLRPIRRATTLTGSARPRS